MQQANATSAHPEISPLLKDTDIVIRAPCCPHVHETERKLTAMPHCARAYEVGFMMRCPSLQLRHTLPIDGASWAGELGDIPVSEGTLADMNDIDRLG